MNVEITVTCPKHGCIVNPMFVAEQLEKRIFEMPKGFKFRLQQLPLRSKAFESKSLKFENKIPVGRIRDSRRNTPDFDEQRTLFMFMIGNNEISVVTTPESQ